jgi:polyhydroxybutyrate depolymerase
VNTRGQRRFQQKETLVIVVGVWVLLGLILSGCSTSTGASNTVPNNAAPAGAASKVRPSSGCSQGSASPPSSAPATSTPFDAAGDSGFYLIDGPTVGTTVALPLLFNLHAYLETAQSADLITGFGAYGVAHGFITVTPQVQEVVPHWDVRPGSADRAFIVALLDHIEATRCIDLRRVYMVGYSNGAFMTSSLVCELGARLAAVATVAGIQAPADCHPKGTVPVIAFHGTADPLVPYLGGGMTPAAKAMVGPDGTGTFGSLEGTSAVAGIAPLTAPIPTQLAHWASRNHCSLHPTLSKAATGVTLISYQCADHHTVELYRENGDGHTWPGSEFTNLPSIRATLGPTTFAINADKLIWAFFQSHMLPG